MTFSLTSSATADTLLLTSGNDTVTGAAGTLGSSDLILDSTTTDNDTANLVVSGTSPSPTISAVENLNLNFALSAAGISLANVSGAKAIGVGSAEAGSTTATVTGIKTGNTFVIDNAIKSVDLTTNSATDNSEAGTLKLQGNTITLTTSATSDIDALTINSVGDANTVTFATVADVWSATGESIVLSGDKNVTLKTGATATSNGFDGATISKSGYTGVATVEYTAAVAGDQNLSKVAVDKIVFSGTPTTGTITVANNASIRADGDIDALTAITTASTDSTLNLSLKVAQAGGTNTLTNFGTVNLSTADATGSVTVNNLTLTQATSLLNANVKISGSQNLTLSSVTAKSVDATGFAKVLTVTTTTQATTVTGGDGKDVLTTGDFASTVNGGAADDTISVNAVTGGKAVSVTGGAGDDTITTGVATATSVYDGGDGADTINVGAATKLVGNFIGGNGTDSIVFTSAGANDISANTFTLSGIEVLDVSATNNTSTFSAAQLTGKTLNIVGAGGDDIVNIGAIGASTAVSIDMSGINHNVSALRIIGSTAADILKGSAAADVLISGNSTGTATADVLTGNGGADVFRFAGSSATNVLKTSVVTAASSVAGMAKVTDFNQAQGDKINLLSDGTPANLLAAGATTTPGALGNAGTVTGATLNAAITAAFADKDQVTSGAQAGSANDAILFSWNDGSSTRTFLAVNDGAAAYAATDDFVIEVTGIALKSGDAALGTLTVSDYFG